MKVVQSIEIDAPPALVWDAVSDPGRYLGFMSGVTRWEVCDGSARGGVGARYRVLMRIGSAEVGGLVEAVEWSQPGDIAWRSVTGIDQRGRWRIRPSGPGGERSRVELRLSYGVPGAGLAGMLAELLAAPQLRGHAVRSLALLRRQVEHEHQRAQAAARRAARAGSGAAAPARASVPQGA